MAVGSGVKLREDRPDQCEPAPNGQSAKKIWQCFLERTVTTGYANA